MDNVPLSKVLEDALSRSRGGASPTVNQLLRRTEGRGVYLFMILLCLPFLTPVPVPGVSSPFGVVILLLAWRIAFRLPPRLPDRIGERRISFSQHPLILQTGIRFLRLVERLVKPRRSHWLAWPLVLQGNAALLALMAALLALPLPIPFSNSLPAGAIVLLAASMMEADGWSVWAGYLMTVVTLGFFAAMGGGGLMLAFACLDRLARVP
jgi:hypothetical protein